MESASLDGCSATRILILSDVSGGGSLRRGKSPSAKRERTPAKLSNRVLMLGRLRELALYRAEVLKHHGFEVIAPATEAEAFAAIRQGTYDIAVVSYTLSDIAVRQFVDLIRQYCPRCPVLAIAQSTRYDRLIEPDSVVVGDEGPDELVKAIRQLLQRQ